MSITIRTHRSTSKAAVAAAVAVVAAAVGADARTRAPTIATGPRDTGADQIAGPGVTPGPSDHLDLFDQSTVQRNLGGLEVAL